MKEYEILAAEFDGVWKNKETKQEGFIIKWAAKGMGFGELTFIKKEDGKLQIDTECMSKEFVEAVVQKMLDDAEYRDG